MLIFAKVEDDCGWFYDNKVQKGVDGYIGGLLAFLRSEGASTPATSYNIEVDAKMPIQDIASYQVPFSEDEKIVGSSFRPLSHTAVNH